MTCFHLLQTCWNVTSLKRQTVNLSMCQLCKRHKDAYPVWLQVGTAAIKAIRSLSDTTEREQRKSKASLTRQGNRSTGIMFVRAGETAPTSSERSTPKQHITIRWLRMVHKGGRHAQPSIDFPDTIQTTQRPALYGLKKGRKSYQCFEKKAATRPTRKRAGRTLGEEVEKTSCWIYQGVEIPQHTVRKLNIIFTICPSVVGCRGFKVPKHLAAVGNHLMMLLWYLLLVISGSHSTGRQTEYAKWGNDKKQTGPFIKSIVLLKYKFII